MSEQHIETQENVEKAPSTKEVITFLAEKFPNCFSLEGEAKPLKIGLFQELSEALASDGNISKTSLRQALRTYTMNWRYLHGCKEGAIRVGLQGEEAGVVDATQAAHAAQTLADAKAAYVEKRAQQRKEERKAFFKQQAKEQNMKKRLEAKQKKQDRSVQASLESLAELENKFGKGKDKRG
ncbi:ProP effector [Nicoletella semolina]|uniref:RNA chaperone ProQ n=1 Tax=Nicoletella semolina TaxID=271160 RepID=A0A4R2NCD1_9PAST|nr:RNA chaperone ProQ [Nicoletella semolina]MDH2924307.1 RNA chaperone ProQ [Nicoletella semolina]TCP18793.1 ProP effector [Nicoletella semolina]